LTLDQLRIFVEVARCEHVTRAAARLNLTQSAVSAAITALEQRHDVLLFNRIGRGIELTAAGRRFVAAAEAVLSRATEAEGLLRDLTGGPSGSLHLAASQTVASYWLPSRLMAFHDAYPAVDLHLSAGNTETVVRDVASGVVDLGVVEGAFSETEFEVISLASDQMSVFVGPRHPWHAGGPVSAADLLGSSWILRERGSGTRSEFERHLATLGMDPAALRVVLDLPSNEACIAAAEAGAAATVLSRRAIGARPGGALREVDIALPARSFRAIRDPRRHPSRATLALLSILQKAPGLPAPADP